MWFRQTVRHAAEVRSPAQKELTYVREEGKWMAASTFTTDSEGSGQGGEGEQGEAMQTPSALLMPQMGTSITEHAPEPFMRTCAGNVITRNT